MHSASAGHSPSTKSLQSALIEMKCFFIFQEIDPWERYEQLEELGRGAHGVIYKVKEKSTGEVFACKMLERKAVNETLRRELVNHRTLAPHPNVIGYKEVSSYRTFCLRMRVPLLAFFELKLALQ